jgi:hypothetical protein
MTGKIATEKHEHKEKSIKVRAGILTSTTTIEVTSIYHCAMSGNVFKTLLFLKVVLKLADLWPNTRRVSEMSYQLVIATQDHLIW